MIECVQPLQAWWTQRRLAPNLRLAAVGDAKTLSKSQRQRKNLYQLLHGQLQDSQVPDLLVLLISHGMIFHDLRPWGWHAIICMLVDDDQDQKDEDEHIDTGLSCTLSAACNHVAILCAISYEQLLSMAKHVLGKVPLLS